MTSNELRELLKKNVVMRLDHHRTSSGIEFSYKRKIILDWKWYADSVVTLDEEKLDFIEEFIEEFLKEDEEVVKKVNKIEKIEAQDPTTWQEILAKKRTKSPSLGATISLGATVPLGLGSFNFEGNEVRTLKIPKTPEGKIKWETYNTDTSWPKQSLDIGLNGETIVRDEKYYDECYYDEDEDEDDLDD